MKYFLLFIKKLLRYTLKPLSFLPAILMMVVIFHFSSQPGAASADISLTATQKILDFAEEYLHWDLDYDTVERNLLTINYYVRKLAHFMEYFIFAFSVSLPLYVYGLRGWKLVVCAGIFCVGFSALDEFHQSFVPGRTSTPKDVLIDSIGIFPGIFSSRILGWLGRKTIFKPLSLRQEEE